MKKFILTFAVVFASVASLFGQYKEHPNALALRWTLNNFQFPYTHNIEYHDYTSGLELTYIRHLGKHFNIAFPLKVMRAELPLDDEGTEGPTQEVGTFDLLFHFKFFNERTFIQPYLLGGAGLMAEFDNDWEINAEYPVGLGLNFRLAPHLLLSLESQYRFDQDDNRDHLQHAAGFVFILGKYNRIADADKDGVADSEDQCPDQKGTAALMGCPDTDNDGVANRLDNCPDMPGLAALAGCPDSDGDGVANHLDACPDVKGIVEKNGCPPTDRDKDGIDDAADRCPDQPGELLAGGCPDADRDGVADSDDKCPNAAGLPVLNGCPDADRDGTADADDRCPSLPGLLNMQGCPDTDSDGIADPDDRCPNSAGLAANRGCPVIEEKVREVFNRALKDVQFETGKAVLRTSSYTVLDEIVGIMNTYPDHKLRISGHTDSIGEPPYNQDLSERRAKACYDYLISKGINAGRLKYEGFGESKPIADNRYAPGREKNRRVEFEIYVD